MAKAPPHGLRGPDLLALCLWTSHVGLKMPSFGTALAALEGQMIANLPQLIISRKLVPKEPFQKLSIISPALPLWPLHVS